LNSELNSSASRSDAISLCKVKKDDKEKKECEKKENDKKFAPFLTLLQSQTSSFDLGDEGFFGTVQLGYDKQFAPRWVIGGFVDADWYSDLEAHGRQSSSSALNVDLKHFLKLDLPLSNITTDASIGIDWSISVGGRLGVRPGRCSTSWVLIPTPSWTTRASTCRSTIPSARSNSSSRTQRRSLSTCRMSLTDSPLAAAAKRSWVGTVRGPSS
jgi:hypothetical protein